MKEVRYNQKLHSYESVNVCPHSSKRTCDGGLNSCIDCPHMTKKTFGRKLLTFITWLVLLITFLILCTMCEVDHGEYTTQYANGMHIIRFKDGRKLLLVHKECTDTVWISHESRNASAGN